MKFLLRTLLIAGLSYFGLKMFDWWVIVLVAFVVGLLLSEKRTRRLYGKKQTPAYAFLSGFLAIALIWGGMAWWMDSQNASLLSQKVFDILSAGMETSMPARWSLILSTAIAGGVLGGFSAMTGNLLGEAIKG